MAPRKGAIGKKIEVCILLLGVLLSCRSFSQGQGSLGWGLGKAKPRAYWPDGSIPLPPHPPVPSLKHSVLLTVSGKGAMWLRSIKVPAHFPGVPVYMCWLPSPPASSPCLVYPPHYS